MSETRVSFRELTERISAYLDATPAAVEMLRILNEETVRLEDELKATRAEVQASRDALALTAVELAEVRKERDRAVERLERAGIA